MAQPELLKRVVDTLDGAGIDYMVTGSVVSSIQGEPRSTHDIDLVVQIATDQVAVLLRSFQSPRYYLSDTAAREAIESRGMFNLLDTSEGDKVDFWLLTDDPFDRSRFSRKITEDVLGLRLNISSPEDTILQKLKWSVEAGGSERSFRDALSVYQLQKPSLDLEYIEHWGHRLGVIEFWDRIRHEGD